MICPFDDKGCSGVDTSGMTKIECEECSRFNKKVKKKKRKIDDLNEFMMGL